MKHFCDCKTADGLAAIGALVQLTLLPHPRVRDSFIASGNLPEPVVNFMVDTGADRTVVEKRVAESMGLTPVRFAPIVGVSGQVEQSPVYLMTLRIGVSGNQGAGVVEFNTEIIGMNTPPIPRQYVGLIGRDFLRNIHVVYNGPKGWVELHVSSELTGAKAFTKNKKKKKR